jgi:hypothetical protein
MRRQRGLWGIWYGWINGWIDEREDGKINKDKNAEGVSACEVSDK